jgi:SAM-dependent methyltransferase
MTKASRPCGTGPGPITPDGCAVDFYAQLPDNGEAAIVHDAAGARTSILELGCGAGRVTRPLTALGHQVVAVDESPEMLAHVRDAETVCARIEDLRLGRRFGAVLLASHLINADDDTRSALLAACRRHVADDGCVIVQQHPREWFSAVKAAETTRDGIIYRMRDVSRPAPNRAGRGRVLTGRGGVRRGLPAALAAALAAERAARGRRAVGAAYLAGLLRAFRVGAGVRAAFAFQRLAELALYHIEIGLCGVLLAGGRPRWRIIRLAGGASGLGSAR